MRCAHGLDNPISLGGREVSSQFYQCSTSTRTTSRATGPPQRRSSLAIVQMHEICVAGVSANTLCPILASMTVFAPALGWRLIREHALERTTRVAIQRLSPIVSSLSHQLRCIPNASCATITGFVQRDRRREATWWRQDGLGWIYTVYGSDLDEKPY